MIDTINKELPFNISNLTKTDMGLTNDNYLLEIAGESYILRYPLKDVAPLFDSKQEAEVLDKIKGLDFTLPVKYYKDGIQLVKFEKDLKTFEDYQGKNKIKKVSDLMEKFHNSNLSVSFTFDPLKQIMLYKKHTKNIKINLDDYSDLFKRLKNHKFTPKLCHNDWVAGNICFINNKTYLIDYEYAGNNDPLFDVMSFLTENDLSNKERVEFLSYMFKDGISEQDYQTLVMYRDINNILWYLWAEMMYEFRCEAIYNEIADIKLSQLKSEYNTNLWTDTNIT